MKPEKLSYREMAKEDLFVWENLAKSDFSPEDFCSADFFLEKGNAAKGWILFNDSNEWIGCCFITFDLFEYNQNGVHFREYWIAPKYRGKGYAKYISKILFDATKGLDKSGCVKSTNTPSIKVMINNGFRKNGRYKIWDLYFCDKDHYPEYLKALEICNTDPKG